MTTMIKLMHQLRTVRHSESSEKIPFAHELLQSESNVFLRSPWSHTDNTR